MQGPELYVRDFCDRPLSHCCWSLRLGYILQTAAPFKPNSLQSKTLSVRSKLFCLPECFTNPTLFIRFLINTITFFPVQYKWLSNLCKFENFVDLPAIFGGIQTDIVRTHDLLLPGEEPGLSKVGELRRGVRVVHPVHMGDEARRAAVHGSHQLQLLAEGENVGWKAGNTPDKKK